MTNDERINKTIEFEDVLHVFESHDRSNDLCWRG